MAKSVQRLTARMVATLRAPGRHADGDSLYLSIDQTGRRRWIFRYNAGKNRVRDMGLGSADVVSLADAREAAQAARKLLAKGIDPIDERQRLSVVDRQTTFGDVADRMLATLRPSWSNSKHAQQWKHSLTVHAAPLRSMPVDKITASDIRDTLQPLWNTHSETASRLRARIERTLDFAKAEGLRTGENPAVWRGSMRELLPDPRKLNAGRRGHVAAMPFDKVPPFFAELRQRQGISARALELTILTACRTNEVLGARWSEIDLDKGEWTIPAERMKARRVHRVPLSSQAVEVLRELRQLQPGELVFPASISSTASQKKPTPMRPLSNMAMATLLRRMHQNNITVHGFRSSFRDWSAERTDAPNEVCEAALSHTIQNKVEAAYRRGDLFDKRRVLMERWGAFCRGDS